MHHRIPLPFPGAHALCRTSLKDRSTLSPPPCGTILEGRTRLAVSWGGCKYANIGRRAARRRAVRIPPLGPSAGIQGNHGSLRKPPPYPPYAAAIDSAIGPLSRYGGRLYRGYPGRTPGYSSYLRGMSDTTGTSLPPLIRDPSYNWYPQLLPPPLLASPCLVSMSPRALRGPLTLGCGEGPLILYLRPTINTRLGTASIPRPALHLF